MKKDAYYFPHFCNARNDSKLVKLRRVLGIEGYGMYWILMEYLAEEGGEIDISDECFLEGLSLDCECESDDLKSFINDCTDNFNLFNKCESIVSNKNINEWDEKVKDLSAKRSAAGKKGAEAKWGKEKDL